MPVHSVYVYVCEYACIWSSNLDLTPVCYSIGWHLATKKKNLTQWNWKKNPSIDWSLCKSICYIPPLHYCPSWPLHPFLFFGFHPHLFLPPRSFQLPLSSPICQWSCYRIASGLQRKGRGEGRQICLSWKGTEWFTYIPLCPNKWVILNLLLSQLCFICLICCSEEDLWCGQYCNSQRYLFVTAIISLCFT